MEPTISAATSRKTQNAPPCAHEAASDRSKESIDVTLSMPRSQARLWVMQWGWANQNNRELTAPCPGPVGSRLTAKAGKARTDNSTSSSTRTASASHHQEFCPRIASPARLISSPGDTKVKLS